MPGMIWLALSFALYGAASCLYCGYLLGWKEWAVRAARAVLLLGFVAHMGEIGARGIAGLHPVTSAMDAVGFAAWLLVGGFLLAHLRWRIGAVGAFVGPTAILMLLVGRLSSAAVVTGAPTGLGVLGRVHIFLATFGVAVFALAAVLAALYLVEDAQLKHRAVGAFVRKGLALETLDLLVHRCVQVGFPLFTVALISGVFWTARRGEALRPEYGASLVAWGTFGGLLVARFIAGWRGRRAAVMTLVGFMLALLVVGIYLARRAVGA